MTVTESRSNPSRFAAENSDGHRAAMGTSAQTSAPLGWAKVPPPALFILPLVAGVLLNRRVRLPLTQPIFYPYAQAIGFSLIGVAAVLLLVSPALFVRYRTTIVPHHHARRLIVAGTYRISRNPMYLGLALLYLGVTFVTNAAWPLFWFALPIWVMHMKIIPMEEENLEHAFGDEYRSYRRRVRRWL